MAPLKIGIAGYMGAGKSSCIKFLEMPSMISLNADQIAKSLMQQSTGIKQELRKSFGAQVCSDQSIDFGLLGSIVFNSPPALNRLNAIVHPPLLQHVHHLMTKSTDPAIRFVLLDAALIPLWNIESWFDVLIWVDACSEVRLKRLIERSGDVLSEKELMKRMVEQELLFKKSIAYEWVDILNNGTEDELKAKCSQLKVMLEAKMSSSLQSLP
jgi:dephospho-CoA kinase